MLLPVAGYSVSPPAGTGMAVTSQPSLNGTFTRYVWKSAFRPDRTRMTFDIQFIQPPDPAERQWPSQDTLAAYSASDLSRLYSAFSTSRTSNREINGLSFIRFYWKGFSPRSHQEEHGFVYNAHDDHQLIRIQGVDREPDNQITLPLCEEAAFTFKRQQVSTP